MDPNLKSQYNTYRLPALLKRILAIILKPIVSVWVCLTCVIGDLQAGEASLCREVNCTTQEFLAASCLLPDELHNEIHLIFKTKMNLSSESDSLLWEFCVGSLKYDGL